MAISVNVFFMWCYLVAFAHVLRHGPLGTTTANPAATDHNRVDLVMKGELAGDGRDFEVDWYHRGPFASSPGQPPSYVRGLAVRALDRAGRTVASWHSPPTALVDFYRDLNGLWPLRNGRGMLITALVQYGGAAYVMNAFRFDGVGLKRLAEVGGRALSLEHLGSLHRPILVVRPSDEFALRHLYALDTPSLSRVDEEFPDFWTREGESWAAQITDPGAANPDYLARFCELAFQAFVLGRKPIMAREPCLAARQRISTSRSEWKYPAHADDAAAARVDRVLGELGAPTRRRPVDCR